MNCNRFTFSVYRTERPMERELTRQIFLKLGHQRLISSQGKISSHTRSVLIVTYQGHLSQYLPLGRYTGYGTCWRLLTTGFHTNRFQLKSWLVSDFHLSPSPSLPYKLASGGPVLIDAEHSMCPGCLPFYWVHGRMDCTRGEPRPTGKHIPLWSKGCCYLPTNAAVF